MTTPKSTPPPKQKDEEPNATVAKSKRQPAWHVILLSVFTFSLYLVYWFYKTVKDLKGHAATIGEKPEPGAKLSADSSLVKYKKANPFWLSVALLTPTALGPMVLLLPPEAGKAIAPVVPLVTAAFFGAIYYDIARLGRDGSLLKNNPSFPAFCLVVAMAMFWTLVKLPSVFYLLFTLVSVPTAIAQHWLNDYWERVEPPEAHMRASFSMGEIITLLVGSIPLTLIMLTP